jgi:hypothetical protein
MKYGTKAVFDDDLRISPNIFRPFATGVVDTGGAP